MTDTSYMDPRDREALIAELLDIERSSGTSRRKKRRNPYEESYAGWTKKQMAVVRRADMAELSQMLIVSGQIRHNFLVYSELVDRIHNSIMEAYSLFHLYRVGYSMNRREKRAVSPVYFLTINGWDKENPRLDTCISFSLIPEEFSVSFGSVTDAEAKQDYMYYLKRLRSPLFFGQRLPATS
jgi:hypothetical protein